MVKNQFELGKEYRKKNVKDIIKYYRDTNLLLGLKESMTKEQLQVILRMNKLTKIKLSSRTKI